MGTNRKDQRPVERPKMTLLEFIDKNGEGLAWFVIIFFLLFGGTMLKLCGKY